MTMKHEALLNGKRDQATQDSNSGPFAYPANALLTELQALVQGEWSSDFSTL